MPVTSLPEVQLSHPAKPCLNREEVIRETTNSFVINYDLCRTVAVFQALAIVIIRRAGFETCAATGCNALHDVEVGKGGRDGECRSDKE